MAQLYFYYSAMNAGKSTSLLQSAWNYKERGMHAELFTAEIDDRFAQGEIASRIGLSAKANLFNADTDMFSEIRQLNEKNNTHCVLIDESQFLTREQVMQLTRVVDELNIPVLCYGLRSDFMGEPFSGSQYLLVWADKMSEIKTVCHCGRKATMVLKIDAAGNPVRQGDQIEIGGEDRYVSVCRKHWFAPEE